MGAVLGLVQRAGINALAFSPPSVATYDKSQCVLLPYEKGAHKVALRVFHPKPGEGEHTAATDTSGTVLLVAHGNGDDLGSAQQLLQWYADVFGLPTVSFDYPGYGQSTGKPSEAGVHASTLAAYEYCIGHLHAQNVIVLGKSLGTSAAVHLATQSRATNIERLRGVVLISPLASGVRTLSAAHFMSKAMLAVLDKEFMPVLVWAANLRVPTCVAHGVSDTVIPIQNSYDIWKRVPLQQRTLFQEFPFCGHNDIESQRPSDMASFLRKSKAAMLPDPPDTAADERVGDA